MAATRNPFKPLGTRLRDFARGKISRYLPAGDTSTHQTAAPSWANDAKIPLDWQQEGETPQVPVSHADDLPSFETHSTTVIPGSFLAPTAGNFSGTPSVQRETADPAQPEPKPMSRGEFLNFLWEKREEQLRGGRPAPEETADSPNPGNIQRAIDGEAMPPRPMGRRRRGAVVDVPSPRASETPTEDSPPDAPENPDFFFVGPDVASNTPPTPSVQAMRDVASNTPAASPQIQRKAESDADVSTDSPVTSDPLPLSAFVSNPAEFDTAPTAKYDAPHSAETGAVSSPAHPIQTRPAQSSSTGTTVQRSVEGQTTSSPTAQSAANETDSSGEGSGLLYMPGDHVTRTESSSASPSSPSIQRTPATNTQNSSRSEQSTPSQSASFSPDIATSESRFVSANVEPQFSDTLDDGTTISAAPYIPDTPQQPSTPIQLQRDPQAQTARSRKSKSVEPVSPTSETPTTHSPAPTNSVQRDMATPSQSIPDAPTMLTSFGEVNDSEAPRQILNQPSGSLQRSFDGQPEYDNQPVSHDPFGEQAQPTELQSQPQQSSSSKPTGTVQRQVSDDASQESSQQPNYQTSTEAPGSQSEYSEPFGTISDAPTLLTPAPSSISRYADLPDSAFNTPQYEPDNQPTYTADAPTQIDASPARSTSSTDAAPTTQRKSKGSIQRKRGALGVSYTPSETTSSQLQRDVNDADQSASPAPTWTPSTELAPPTPPSFAEPSPWSNYMESPAFEEPPKPVGQKAASASASNQSGIQRSTDTSNAGTTAPQYSAMPDSSFMTDAPQAAPTYSSQNAPAQEIATPFMPPASASASPQVQRSVQPEAVQPDASELPIHPFDISQALANDYVDPPQYNRQSGSVQPPRSSSMPAAQAPSISRTLDTGSTSSSSQPSHNFSPDANVPIPGSVEAEMLTLLNLPPNTPVAGLKPMPAANPQISRMTSNEGEPVQRFTSDSRNSQPNQQQVNFDTVTTNSTTQSIGTSPVLNQPVAPSDPSIQRELAGEASPPGVAGSPSNDDKSELNAKEIDDLAREVYGILRKKLRDEHERRVGH